MKKLKCRFSVGVKRICHSDDLKNIKYMSKF